LQGRKLFVDFFDSRFFRPQEDMTDARPFGDVMSSATAAAMIAEEQPDNRWNGGDIVYTVSRDPSLTNMNLPPVTATNLEACAP